MKIAKYVFYRTYNDYTALYNTMTKMYYKFSSSVGEILGKIELGKNIEEIVESFAQQYQIGAKEIRGDIVDCIDLMIAEKILIAPPSMEVTVEERCVWDCAQKAELYEVLLELTYCCNEKCKHCYVCNSGNKKELSFQEIVKLLDDLRAMNVFTLTLTGGEVLCRPDFMDILEETSKRRFVIDIYTNGVLFDADKILKVAKIHPRSIHFSLYSDNAEEHDYITGVKGSFHKTLAVAKSFLDIGIAVNFKTILLKNNVGQILQIIDMAKSLGATVQIGTSFRLKHDGDTSPLLLKPDKTQYQTILPEIFEKMKESKENVIAKREKESKICSAGFSSLSINPYGEVYACSSLPFVVGNIRERSIQEIWATSKPLMEWRKNTFGDIHSCGECEHSSICAYCPGIAMQLHGNKLKKYEDACSIAEAVVKYIKKEE